VERQRQQPARGDRGPRRPAEQDHQRVGAPDLTAAAAAGAQAGTLVFSHANGFPAGTYRRLFEAWRAAGWRVVAIERIGHDPAWPVTGNWPHLRDHLLAFAEAQAPGQPVWFVGHSLGGFLSVMAAAWRPQKALGVVLLDSPIVAGWKAQALRMAKTTGLIHRVSPGKVSRRRRWQWPSADAVLAHFQAKAAFARWEPSVLADYATCGFDPAPDDPGARVLGFRREIETRIYDTLPHHVPQLLRRHPVRCPVHFLGGTQSAEVRQVGLAATRALTQGRIAWIEGSHLFPMERPDETAAAVLAAISGFVPARG
jgi:pimeloyl-ACP methyl ester carboxylesterase